MLRPVKAIAFDLDDTLCGYWDAAKSGLAQTFRELSPTGFTPEQLQIAWAEEFHAFCPNLRELGFYEDYLESGKPTRDELMRRMLLRLGIDDGELATRLGDRYAENRRHALKLFPEIPELLNALHGKFPLALITNGPADIQREEIADLGIGHYFDLVLIEGEQKVGKPHPSVFQTAQDHFGVGAESMLFVGNSYNHDIAPAISAGWQTVWVRRPSDIAPSNTESDAKPEEKPKGAQEPTLVLPDLGPLVGLLETSLA